MPCMIIADSDSTAAKALETKGREFGFTVQRATSLHDTRSALADGASDLLLMDPDLTDGNGLQLLIDGEIPQRTDILIMGTDIGEKFAARCLRLGADDFLRKPLDDGEIEVTLGKYRDEIDDVPPATCTPEGAEFGLMLGESRPMLRLYRLLSRVAGTDATVLLIGESGTGKEQAAQTLHQLSQRSDAPFVPVNCGAIPEDLAESQLFGHEKGSFTGAEKKHAGFFQQADGGTLFLDEITEMDSGQQVKLLRALETGCIRTVGGTQDLSVDVRVIAATNRDPDEAMDEGLLREDLYYRLCAFPIRLPPLRNRGSDVLLLASHFLRELGDEHGREVRLSDEASDRLRIHDWPGNVRELKNAMTRAFIMADDVIEAEDLPQAILDPNEPSGDLLRVRVGESIAEAEKKLIFATLQHNDGDKTQTARELGISVKTLYNRLKSYEDDADTAASA